MVKRRHVKGGGSPSVSLGEVEARLRLRSLMPQTLTYDPFENPQNTRRLLLDLVTWTLGGKIHHRLAGTIRNLIGMWIRVDEHERLDEIERRLSELEKAKAGSSQ